VYTSKSKKKIESMNMITSEARSCLECRLGENRKNVVVGSGSLDAEIVLIGEAPGRKEDESGLPFVGSAGKLLDSLLESAGLKREKIFIGNILKCRPPGNRRPKKSEIEACEPYLKRQLEIIKPRIIAPMGNSALSYFQSRYGLIEEPIGEAHGKVFEVEASWGMVKLIPLYHPAAAIYKRQLLGDLEKDMKKLATL
jgi:uracil-DNA glycosylase family 4